LNYNGLAAGTGMPVAVCIFICTVDKAGIAEQENGLANVEVLRTF
jgi:hypothetical protein